MGESKAITPQRLHHPIEKKPLEVSDGRFIKQDGFVATMVDDVENELVDREILNFFL